MKRFMVALSLCTLLFNVGGCTPSYLHLSSPQVYVKKDLHLKERTYNLTVLPFESPSYYPEIGMYTAQLFFYRLMRKEPLEVRFSQNTDWYEKGKSWEEKTALALEEGKRSESDYILIGSIDRYEVGHITSNQVTVTARLLEVESGDTVYFASIQGTGKPGKTYLLLDLKAGEPTPSTTSLLSAVVNKLIKDCFGKKGVYWKPFHSLL